MQTRRSFLKTSIAGTGLLVSTGTNAFALQSIQERAESIPVLIFSDENSALTTAFSTTLSKPGSSADKTALSSPATVSQIDRDVLRQTEELKTFCLNTPKGVLIGLTRDSDYFVLEHSAAELGFTPLYKGIHDFRGELMRHKITAPEPLAPAVAETLAHAQGSWPKQLARVIPDLVLAGGDAQSAEAVSTEPYQSSESGYLVSWVLKAV